jgi:futalosine hydrolase
MQILVTAATAQEIKPFTDTAQGVDTLITGVGSQSCIYHLLKQIKQNKYDLIIQVGIAGSFTKTFSLGSVLLVQQDCFADLGFEEKEIFTPVFNTTFANKNEWPFTNGWLINHMTGDFIKDLQKVNAVTVNKVSDSALQKAQLIDNYQPDIESMEGAALHFVCLQENIPFLQVRALSNYVGDRDKKNWKINEAITNLNIKLMDIINQLKDQINI